MQDKTRAQYEAIDENVNVIWPLLYDLAYILSIHLLIIIYYFAPSDVFVRFALVWMPWLCAVCQAGAPAQHTYSSVLVFGTADMNKVQQEQNATCMSSPVANVMSYCVKCRTVTATLNTELTTCENLMRVHKRHGEYTQQQMFLDSFPSKEKFRKLLRKNSRKHGCARKSRPLVE